MAYHYGLEIKKLLKKRGMTVTEFARRINKSRENVYNIFTRKSLDIELLNTISQVLEHDLLAGLAHTERARGVSRHETAHETSALYGKFSQEVSLMREELHLLRKEVSDLRDRIAKVENRKK
jgi:transcriptional regulator with XRE-family HTH domain